MRIARWQMVGICLLALSLEPVSADAKKSDKAKTKSKSKSSNTKSSDSKAKGSKSSAGSSQKKTQQPKMNKKIKTTKPVEPQVCLASVGFSGDPVYDKNHILPSVCGIHNSRTCCDQRHVRWIAAKLLAMQRANFNEACIASTRQALCGLCDGDFGTGRSAAIVGQSVTLCPHLCGEWYITLTIS